MLMPQGRAPRDRSLRTNRSIPASNLLPMNTEGRDHVKLGIQFHIHKNEPWVSCS